MRVICTENSVLIDEGEDNGKVCAHKGSIYHVIDVINGEEMREKTGINYASGPWYEFLEMEGKHHHIRFLEIPDDTNELMENLSLNKDKTNKYDTERTSN